MAAKKVKEAKVVEKKSVAELQADLLTARASLHNGTLSNPHAINVIRKNIARAKTAERLAAIANETKGEN